jgi:predicted enzyme related to lactoylglutathione lyase
MSTSIRTTRHVYALDCPDAAALAQFYARLLGWRTSSSEDDPGWVDVIPREGESTGFAIACQRVPDHRAPDWPDGAIPQQAHLDLYVDSIAEAGPVAEAAGATRHPVQPSEDGTFAVFLDPAGHPFCLCEN